MTMNNSAPGARPSVNTILIGSADALPPPEPMHVVSPSCVSFCTSSSSNSSISSATDSSSAPSTSVLSAQAPRSSHNVTQRETSKSKDTSDAAMEAMVVREMNAMSMAERERVLEEVHGVDEAFDEGVPGAVEAKLGEMRSFIDDAPVKLKAAYTRALFLSPKFVNDVDYRLMFLRAVRFDARVAAKKYMTYFEHKRQLFGEDKIVKRITWDDLSPADQAALNLGYVQYLPHTDQSGRGIVVIIETFNKLIPPMSQIRGTWYLYMSAVDGNVEVQRKGIITIMHNCGSSFFENFDPRRNGQGPNLTNSLPAYPPAVHYCYSEAAMRPAISVLQLMIQRHSRVRFRAHFGSHMECKFKLLSYGMPIHVLPFDDDGNIHTKYLQLFLEDRRRIEAEREKEIALKDPSRVEYPNSMDVLLGRGRPYHDFPGNVQLAAVIDQYRPYHAQLRHGKKGELASHIVSLVRGSGARFLKRDEDQGGWYIVSDQAACDKVHHGFRGKPRQAAVWKRGQPPPQLRPLPALTTDFVQLQQHDTVRTGLVQIAPAPGPA